MNTLIVHPRTADEETAIRIFLDALHVAYRADDTEDDTAYLLSSGANAEHLKKSFEQGQNGELTALSLDDVWKP